MVVRYWGRESAQFSHVWLFVTPGAIARQASLSITNSQNLLKFISFESVMPSNHLIVHCPLLSRQRLAKLNKAVKLFCMTMEWWIHVITCLCKPIECTIPRLSWNVNYGFQDLIMCQCRLISCHTGTLCWGMLIMGEVVHLWGQGVYEKTLYLLLNHWDFQSTFICLSTVSII